jgi:hypothetical protein
MDTEIFAEWLRRQGIRVVRSKSSYWYKVGPRIYQAFPFHWVINPKEEELLNVIKQSKALGLRYSTSLDNPIGKISYHIVWDDSSYDLALLPWKVRHDILKGLEYASVQRIEMDRLETEGWLLRQETITRQGRVKAESERWWRGLCNSAKDLPGFEAWGAIHDNKLVSSILAFTFDDCYTFLYMQSATAHLKYGINNAILYHATTEALKQKGIKQVFVGYQSLDAPESVDRFKLRMRYKVKPVRQRVVFHPGLRLFFNSASHAALRSLVRIDPGNSIFSKTEGMLRFYLQGRLPLIEQSLPEALKGVGAIISESDAGDPA